MPGDSHDSGCSTSSANSRDPAQERWQRLRAVVEAALDAGGDGRRAELDRLCASDDALRDAASAMIERAGDNGPELESPFAGAADSIVAELAASEMVGRRFGAYRTIGVIGAGAGGAVYHGVRDDTAFERDVAIKVLGAGAFDERSRARFERECRLQAGLDHPGVCALLDAGTTDDGHLFIVMERVRGQPLTAWASARRPTPRTAVALMADVCAAVGYAHAHGVVHRDLKPANILVIDEGTPGTARAKVIDFGIARVMNSEAPLTIDVGAARLIGTVAYMSPEQAAGGPARTGPASDVYSLGVVLYELLSGRPPLDVRGLPLPEAARVIQDEDAPRLGTLDRSLRGDLETIVGKALEKDPSRRYDDAAGLGDDLRRWLSRQPIRARPPSVLYRLGRLAGRHRAVTASLTTVLVVLAGAVWLTGAEYLRSERDAARARDANEFLEGILTSTDPFGPPVSVAGPVPRRAGPGWVRVTDVLDSAAERLSAGAIGDPLTEATVRYSLGLSYSGLGEREKSIAQLRRALDLRTAQLGPTAPETLDGASALATALDRAGRFDEAAPLHDRAVTELRRTVGPVDDRTLRAMFGRAMFFLHASRLDDAAQAGQEMESALSNAGQADSALAALASAVRAVAVLCTGDTDQGEPLTRQALDRVRHTCGDDHYIAALCVCSLAGAAQARADYTQAEGLYRDAIQRYERLLGPDDPRTLSRVNSLGCVLMAQGRYADAEPLLRRAAAVRLDDTVSAEVAARARQDLDRCRFALEHPQGSRSPDDAHIGTAPAPPR